MTVHNLSEDEAIALMSIAADVGITQVVDGNWGVHGTIAKDMFAERRR
jgi:acetamidase/formamidase